MATTTARVTPVVTKIIDGDGHLYERDEDIRPYLQGKYGGNAPHLLPVSDSGRLAARPAPGGTATMPQAGRSSWTHGHQRVCPLPHPWPGLRVCQGP